MKIMMMGAWIAPRHAPTNHRGKISKMDRKEPVFFVPPYFFELDDGLADDTCTPMGRLEV